MTVSLNSGEDPTDVLVDVYGFGQQMNQIYLSLEPAEDVSPYSARSFIKIDNRSIHLQPGIPQTISAKISVPANSGPGGRYALIYIHALPGKGKAFTTAVLVPVFITIQGTTPTLTGSITDVAVGAVTVGEPIKVTTTFRNTGNYHYYRTVNSVMVKDSAGNPVGDISTNPAAYAIIPGNTVQYAAMPALQNIPAGTYTVESKVLLEDGTVLDNKTASFSISTKYVPPFAETSIMLTPGSEGTLTTKDGNYMISFPKGAVLSDALVTLKPYGKDKLQSAPASAKLGVTCFEITGLSGLLNKDAMVQVKYSSDDLATAGGDASQLKLSYFDTAQNVWVILPTKVNTGTMTLTTTTNHLSVWAVMVSSSTSTGFPSSAPTKKTSLPMVLSIAGLAATAILVRGRVSQKK